MALNGAKDVVLQAIKDLECQICKQVQSPTPAPKAAFARPTSFNQRVVMDTFYVWDANNFKFAVTHLVDAFSLYQIAVASTNASSNVVTHLVRDLWISVFGPPQTLMTDGGREFEGNLELVLKTFQVFHDIVPPTAHWRMALAERHGAVLKLMIMKVIKEKSIMGMGEMQSAVVASTASRNMQARVSGYSPMQLVFGKENFLPGNLMDAMEHGYLHYQPTDPTTMDDAFRRSLDIRRAAEEAFRWIQTNEALRRAATSKARLPKLEMLIEGSMVMFWEPPANRRGLGRRLQDDVSWVGPGMVVGIERKEGAIKRVWVRYRNKLKGLPLEFIRLAVAEEVQAQDINMEAFRDMENQLQLGRTVEIHAPPKTADDGPQHKDANYPVIEFSDEEHPEHPDAKKARLLDDVPLAMRAPQMIKDTLARADETATSSKDWQGRGPPGDPTTWSFPDKRRVFEKRETVTQALQRTQAHTRQMQQKLAPQQKRQKTLMQPRKPEVQQTSESDVVSITPSEVFVSVTPAQMDVLLLNETAESESVTDDELVEPIRDVHALRNFARPIGNVFPNTSVQTLVTRFATDGPQRPRLTIRVPKQFQKMPGTPIRFAQVLDETQAAFLHHQWRLHEQDFWLWLPQEQELWRVHKIARTALFVPDTLNEPVGPLPLDIDSSWFRGPRSTLVYSHNHVEVIVDNFKWSAWNPRQDLLTPWVGVTRFLMLPPDRQHAVLATWLASRADVEQLWRRGADLVERWQEEPSVWTDVFLVQSDIGDLMDTYVVDKGIVEHEPMEKDTGYKEVNDDIQDLPTGKVRLELRWQGLSEAWKKAFQDPIKEALDVYFKYDAVAPVMQTDDIKGANIMPSRFVLVNKTDPRNCSPSDEQLEGSRLKARWVVAGHRDAEAGLHVGNRSTNGVFVGPQPPLLLCGAVSMEDVVRRH